MSRIRRGNYVEGEIKVNDGERAALFQVELPCTLDFFGRSGRICGIVGYRSSAYVYLTCR